MFTSNRFLSRLLRSGALAVALTACSQGGGFHGYVPATGDGGVLAFPPGSDLAAGPDMAVPPKAAYPEGPYGNQVDDVISNLKMEGYRLSVEQSDVSMLEWDKNIQLADYHNNKSCECLLITWGATWCGACKQEQPALIADVKSDPHFCVLNILQEGPAKGPNAVKADVDNWINAYHQNFFVTLGTTTTRNQWNGHGPTIGLPFNFIVQPKTMKILEVINGYRQDIHTHAMQVCGG